MTLDDSNGEGDGVDLRVSENGRYLEKRATGEPFYYLGDTAWELFSRLRREEAIRYLDDRAARGFTVIQAAAITCFVGSGPNAYGDSPCDGTVSRLHTTPGGYWDHVACIMDEAARRGLYVALTAVWANQVSLTDETRPVSAGNAEAYGRFLGSRFGRKPNVLWQLVGDAPERMHEEDAWKALWRALARGIAVGARGTEAYDRLLLSFHPTTHAPELQNEKYLSFQAIQSGHNQDCANAPSWTEEAYNRRPLRPVLDVEHTYEDLLRDDMPEGRNAAADVRKNAYWSVFAGACGHSYSHASLFQMWQPDRRAWDGVRIPWPEALTAPGGDQMRHLKALIESRPVSARLPDQTLVTEALTGADHIRATRGTDYLFVYSAQGRPFTVRMGRISGKNVRAAWFDPRTGMAQTFGTVANVGERRFAPPSQGRGNDWVLILDDEAMADRSPLPMGSEKGN
jgi:hypothetical protein